jgi:hypothetical protein
MKKKLAIAAVAVVAVLGTLLIPVGGKAHSIPDNKDKSMDLSSYPADKPSTP